MHIRLFKLTTSTTTRGTIEHQTWQLHASGAISGDQRAGSAHSNSCGGFTQTNAKSRRPTTVLERGDNGGYTYVSKATRENVWTREVPLAEAETEIAKRLGVELALKDVVWDTITAGNWNGRWDVSVGSMTITPERAEVLPVGLLQREDAGRRACARCRQLGPHRGVAGAAGGAAAPVSRGLEPDSQRVRGAGMRLQLNEVVSGGEDGGAAAVRVLTQDEAGDALVVLLTSRIESKEDRLQYAVALITSRLTRRRAVECPLWKGSNPDIFSFLNCLEDLCLASKLLSRLCSINPNIFCYYNHFYSRE
jgi:hypothetical protein